MKTLIFLIIILFLFVILMGSCRPVVVIVKYPCYNTELKEDQEFGITTSELTPLTSPMVQAAEDVRLYWYNSVGDTILNTPNYVPTQKSVSSPDSTLLNFKIQKK